MVLWWIASGVLFFVVLPLVVVVAHRLLRATRAAEHAMADLDARCDALGARYLDLAELDWTWRHLRELRIMTRDPGAATAMIRHDGAPTNVESPPTKSGSLLRRVFGSKRRSGGAS